MIRSSSESARSERRVVDGSSEGGTDAACKNVLIPIFSRSASPREHGTRPGHFGAYHFIAWGACGSGAERGARRRAIDDRAGASWLRHEPHPTSSRSSAISDRVIRTHRKSHSLMFGRGARIERLQHHRTLAASSALGLAYRRSDANSPIVTLTPNHAFDATFAGGPADPIPASTSPIRTSTNFLQRSRGTMPTPRTATRLSFRRRTDISPHRAVDCPAIARLVNGHSKRTNPVEIDDVV